MSLINPFGRLLHLYPEILAAVSPVKTFVMLLSGIAVGWWIYVPIHELMHVLGCVLGGGEVRTLEIKPEYGGVILAKLFSFVRVGSDYAGRLSAFDTRGSDWTYGLTVYFPYILTLASFRVLGFSVKKKSVFLFGFMLPCALAPLVSLTGDFLELGSILLFQVWSGPHDIHRLLISDDLFRLLKQITAGQGGILADAKTYSFVGISLFTGAAMAWGTFLAADFLAGPGTNQ